VRDRDDGSVLEDAAAQGALQVCVSLDVNRGLSLLLAESVTEKARELISYGCLVQNKDVAWCQQCACERDQLALALT
jgi:hypothetical protein